MTDVIVVGGGPSGSVCAARLARFGLSVIVLEKATFPRFRLGESLLPRSLATLTEIGVLDAVRERFIEKHGARFHDDIQGRKERFGFASAWKPEFDHAFQVPRDEFDALLLAHARASGADVRHRWTAERIVKDEHGRAIGVDVVDPGRRRVRLNARFVVDASGRDLLTARSAGSTTKIDGLDQTALYAHFEGVPRQAGELEGDIDIVLFRSEPGAQAPNWFWFIPFKDGRTSVGAVVSRAWMRDRRRRLASDEDLNTALFRSAVAESTSATALLADARCLWPRAQAAADFSYRVGAMHGPGWLAVGDAGGFIDPLFSTGVHLAMSGAARAADAIAQVIAAPTVERDVLPAWERDVRLGAETFILAVQAFYAGPLVDLLFAQEKHPALRASIASLLAGDVWSDAVWLRDTRARLKAMVAEAWSTHMG